MNSFQLKRVLISALLCLLYGGTKAYKVRLARFPLENFKMSTILMPSKPEAGANLDFSSVPKSTLKGKALEIYSRDDWSFPTLAEVKNKIPAECFVKDTKKSLMFALFDVVATSVCVYAGIKCLLPMLSSSSSPIAKALANVVYSVITGTVAIGMWVTAHEAGHGAFSDNRKLQDLVGYIFHSILLVPYFSWQRSHSVHHANTNHITDGETHVPVAIDSKWPSGKKVLSKVLGRPLGAELHFLIPP